MIGGPSYLCLAGNEISNEVRTLSYLLRGLGGPNFEVATNGSPNPSALVSGYSDIYSDIYEGDTSFASFLACYCADLDDGSNYESPADDPAPWYDAARPGASGDFLGIIFDVIDLAPAAVRSIAARSSGGGTMGRLRTRPRVVQFHGTMYAASARGMEYGRRWLNKALAGSMCAGCGGDDAELLPACSAEGDSGFRTLHEVGLIDGPVFPAIDGVPPDTMTEVAFQLGAGNPYLHAERASDSFTGGGFSTTLETSEWQGDTAVRLDVTAVTDVSGLVIKAMPTTSDGVYSENNTCARYVIGQLSAGDTLTIDATNARVTLLDNTSKSEVSGFSSLNFDSPFPWLIIQPCSKVRLAVAAGSGTAHVVVTQSEREL